MEEIALVFVRISGLSRNVKPSRTKLGVVMTYGLKFFAPKLVAGVKKSIFTDLNNVDVLNFK